MSNTRPETIELRGVQVHNLKSVDIDIPLRQLTVITGVSGSGKSSLAFDTLAIEGRRRYIETFSATARQHLDRLEKPAARQINHIPPAVAFRQDTWPRSSQATVSTVTEIDDLLRVLLCRLGTIVCQDCGHAVTTASATSVADFIRQLPDGTRCMVGFNITSRRTSSIGNSSGEGLQADRNSDFQSNVRSMTESGFTRAVVCEPAASHVGSVNHHTGSISPEVAADKPRSSSSARPAAVTALQELLKTAPPDTSEVVVVADRIVVGRTESSRLLESIETAFRDGRGECVILVEDTDSSADTIECDRWLIDGRIWSCQRHASRLICGTCRREFSKPTPQRLNFRSPLGACPDCHGRGHTLAMQFSELLPDPASPLSDAGAVALAGSAGRREWQRLLKFATSAGIDVKQPCGTLTTEHQRWLVLGSRAVPAESPAIRNGELHEYAGLLAYFENLDQQNRPSSQKQVARWATQQCCPTCDGSRLNDEALALWWFINAESHLTTPAASCQPPDGGTPTRPTKASGWNFARLLQLPVNAATELFDRPIHELSPAVRTSVQPLIDELLSRLRTLQRAGLGYLSLERSMQTLSRGEARRVAMSGLLASRLVNTLFVLDEPTAGLHSTDVQRLLPLLRELRDAGNTVVVVEHDETLIAEADQVIDIGPGAGSSGGQVVFIGPPAKLSQSSDSVTAQWMPGGRFRPAQTLDSDNSSTATEPNCPQHSGPRSRQEKSGILTITGCTHHNLKNIDIDFPLGCLCVVTGPSGAGKSSLVEETLFPAVCRAKGLPVDKFNAGSFSSLHGADAIGGVELIDDQPLIGSRRSTPVTWLKVFDDIRRLFASTQDARQQNLAASAFSFNTAGGRCEKCDGLGQVTIDMQFLADVTMTCPDCHGTRFQRHILEIHWRGRSVADVLAMTAAEAFTFFRGERAIQKRLRTLKDVGLDYLPLGQPLSTLSGGESQRLKLAACLASTSRSKNLIIMNEPSSGLHPADVARLLVCLRDLLSVGHSLLVIEHDRDMLAAADVVIELGPGAGPDGGRIVSVTSRLM